MHILTLKPTTTAKEVAQLKALEPLQKRYLSRRAACASTRQTFQAAATFTRRAQRM